MSQKLFIIFEFIEHQGANATTYCACNMKKNQYYTIECETHSASRDIC